MKICYNCFHEVKASDKHCGNCGYDLSEDNDRKYPQALPCGSVLHGQYIIGRVLGQGGFGITYVAQEYNTGELVAIKEYFPGNMSTRSGSVSVQAFNLQISDGFAYGKKVFLEEATTLSRFKDNPNIVSVRQFFEENGTAYFVMEYIDGESLKNYVRRKGGRLPWEETVKILLPVMDALDAVHKEGIIHRDISPDNIALSKSGTVKLLDFGAARYSMGEKSQSLSVVLKHGFAPAEQYSRHGKQGPWTDVYAMAATIYMIVTGKMAPDSIDRVRDDNLELPSTLGISIPEYAERALQKALSVNYEQRFQSMSDFKDALINPGADYTPVSPVAGSTGGSVPGYTGGGNIPGSTGGSVPGYTGGGNVPGSTGGGNVPGSIQRGPQKGINKKLIIAAAAALIVLVFLIGASFGKSRNKTVYDKDTDSTLSKVTNNPDTPVEQDGKDDQGNPDGNDGADLQSGTDGNDSTDQNGDSNANSRMAEGTDNTDNAQLESNAKAYVKAILDFICTGEYDTSSINFTDLDSLDIADVREILSNTVISGFEQSYTLTDESKDVITKTMLKCLTKCSYSVDNAVVKDDESVDVTVSIKPLRLYDGVEDKLMQELSEMDTSELTDMSEDERNNFLIKKMFEIIDENLENPSYDPAEDVIVNYHLMDTDNKIYGISETDGFNLGVKLISQDSGGGDSSDSGSDSSDSPSAILTGVQGSMTDGNFYNKGYYAFNGNDCYYSHYSRLYKCSGQTMEDPVELERGFGDAFINIWGDYIYYPEEYKSAISRCDLDGKNSVVVFDGSQKDEYAPENLYIHEGWAYFSNGHSLYRISMEKLSDADSGAVTEPECIASDFNFTEAIFPSMCFVGGKIYYNGEGGIARINPDGSDREVISEETGTLVSDGSTLICQWAASKITRIDEDGTATELLKLSIANDGFMDTISCADDMIYYVLKTDDAHEVWKIRTDGTGNERIDEVCSTDHTVISFCTFPGNDYGYFYLLKSGDDGLTPVSKCVKLK